MFVVDAVDTFDQKYNFWLFSNICDGFPLLFPRGFLLLKNVLIQPMLGLEKCSLHENGVEFHQKLIGNVILGQSQQSVCSAGKTCALLRVR